MATIIHDPTRGWLLLTPEGQIEIAKEDWGEVNRITGCAKPKVIIIPNHKLFPVDREFQVAKQFFNTITNRWQDREADSMDLPQEPVLEYRQIARLVKAKEDIHEYTLTVDRTFPARFKLFLSDIQVNDLMGQEELDYLKSYQDKFKPK